MYNVYLGNYVIFNQKIDLGNVIKILHLKWIDY